MPRSKSRKTNRRSATAAKTASSRARPDGQQAVRADPQIGAAMSRADGKPGAAGQAPAGPAPAETPEELPAWVAKATEKGLTVPYWLGPRRRGDRFRAPLALAGPR